MATVTNKARTDNVATLTTAAAHGLSADNYVKVTGVTDLNTTHARVIAAPTATTLTYASIGDDIASVASTGTVVAGVDLTVAQVTALTAKTVTADFIELGAETILEYTGWTPTQYRDVDLIPTASVQAAWAVVTARLMAEMKAAGDEAVISESQDGYSQSQDPTLAARYLGNPMAGYPSKLLGLATVTSIHARPGDVIVAT